MRSYCIYCKTGTEEKLQKSLVKLLRDEYFGEVRILFPVRVLHERSKRVWGMVERPLLPGYLFLYLDGSAELDQFLIKSSRDVFRILKNSDGTMQLRGLDEKYALWVYQHNGRFEPSKVIYKPGHKIKVLSGPLAEMEGKIVKVDRHHKRVVVAFMFGGVERRINLSIEVISSTKGEDLAPKL